MERSRTHQELIAEATEIIKSMTAAEAQLLLSAWKIYEKNPTLTPGECVKMVREGEANDNHV